MNTMTKLTLTSILFLTACSFQEQPPKDPVTIVPGSAERKQAKADADAESRQERMRKDGERSKAWQQSFVDKAQQERVDMAKEADNVCNASREVRLNDLKRAVREWHAELKDVLPTDTWLQKNCHDDDPDTVVVQRRATKDGTAIRVAREGDAYGLVCPSPRPAFVTDAMMHRWSFVNFELTNFNGGRPLYTGPYKDANSRCNKSDAAAGVNFWVTFGDGKMQGEILAK